MSIGSRLKYFRTLKGLTQKQLGVAIGIAEATAEARVGQYEIEYRTPKDDYIINLAKVLEVSPSAITAPNIDSNSGIAHTFFMLEDVFKFSVEETTSKKISLTFDKTNENIDNSMQEFFIQWYEMKNKLETGEMTKQEYDQWRYNYKIVQNI